MMFDTKTDATCSEKLTPGVIIKFIKVKGNQNIGLNAGDTGVCRQHLCLKIHQSWREAKADHKENRTKKKKDIKEQM